MADVFTEEDLLDIIADDKQCRQLVLGCASWNGNTRKTLRVGDRDLTLIPLRELYEKASADGGEGKWF